MKTIKPLITIILLLIIQVSFAQKNYSAGYVITLENDTIHGKIRDRFPFRFHTAHKKIKIIDQNGEKTKFKAKEVKGYSKSGIIEYMTVQDDLGKSFARVLLDGDIKLLTIHKSGTHSLSEPNAAGGISSTHDTYSDHHYFLYNSATSQATKVNPFIFKNQMGEYFSDYEKLAKMIENKELRIQDLEIIVTRYNNRHKNQPAAK